MQLFETEVLGHLFDRKHKLMYPFILLSLLLEVAMVVTVTLLGDYISRDFSANLTAKGATLHIVSVIFAGLYVLVNALGFMDRIWCAFGGHTRRFPGVLGSSGGIDAIPPLQADGLVPARARRDDFAEPDLHRPHVHREGCPLQPAGGPQPPQVFRGAPADGPGNQAEHRPSGPLGFQPHAKAAGGASIE